MTVYDELKDWNVLGNPSRIDHKQRVSLLYAFYNNETPLKFKLLLLSLFKGTVKSIYSDPPRAKMAMPDP